MAGESRASRQLVGLQPLIQKKFEAAARQQEGCHQQISNIPAAPILSPTQGHRETLYQTGRVNYPEAAMVLNRSREEFCTRPRPGVHLRPRLFLPAGLGRQLSEGLAKVMSESAHMPEAG